MGATVQRDLEPENHSLGLGVYSLGVYSLGVYSLGVYNLVQRDLDPEMHSLGLEEIYRTLNCTSCLGKLIFQLKMGFGGFHWVERVGGIHGGGLNAQVHCSKLRFVDFL